MDTVVTVSETPTGEDRWLDTVLRRAVSPPIRTGGDDFEVHTLVCHRHVLFYLFALRAFLQFSGSRPSVVIYDDGSLTREDLQVLRDVVPAARVLPVDCEEVPAALSNRPACRALFEQHLLGRRLLSSWFHGRSERLLFLDSDVLFFAPPTELMEWLRSAGSSPHSLYNRDSSSKGSVALDEGRVRSFGSRPLESFNAGLLATRRDIFDLDLIEAVAAELCARRNCEQQWLYEQTVLAVLVGRHDARPLPPTYAFQNHANAHRSIPPMGLISKHYSRPVRPDFFTEGVHFLIAEERL